MKKIILMMPVMALIFMLCSCGSSSSKAEDYVKRYWDAKLEKEKADLEMDKAKFEAKTYAASLSKEEAEAFDDALEEANDKYEKEYDEALKKYKDEYEDVLKDLEKEYEEAHEKYKDEYQKAAKEVKQNFEEAQNEYSY